MSQRCYVLPLCRSGTSNISSSRRQAHAFHRKRVHATATTTPRPASPPRAFGAPASPSSATNATNNNNNNSINIGEAASNATPLEVEDRHSLMLAQDMGRVVRAYEAVDEHALGFLDFAGFCRLCWILQVKVEQRAFTRARMLSAAAANKSTSSFKGVATRLLALEGEEEEDTGERQRRDEDGPPALRQYVLAVFFPSASVRSVELEAAKHLQRKPRPPKQGVVPSDFRMAFRLCEPTTDDGANNQSGEGCSSSSRTPIISLANFTKLLHTLSEEKVRDIFLDNSREMELRRRNDVRTFQSRVHLCDMFRCCKLRAALRVMNTVHTDPPLSISNLCLAWEECLREQFEPHLDLPQLTRLCDLVTTIRRFGPMCVLRLQWSDDLEKPPPFYTLQRENSTDVFGQPRVPLAPDECTMDEPSFTRLMTTPAAATRKEQGWGSRGSAIAEGWASSFPKASTATAGNANTNRRRKVRAFGDVVPTPNMLRLPFPWRKQMDEAEGTFSVGDNEQEEEEEAHATDVEEGQEKTEVKERQKTKKEEETDPLAEFRWRRSNGVSNTGSDKKAAQPDVTTARRTKTVALREQIQSPQRQQPQRPATARLPRQRPTTATTPRQRNPHQHATAATICGMEHRAVDMPPSGRASTLLFHEIKFHDDNVLVMEPRRPPSSPRTRNSNSSNTPNAVSPRGVTPTRQLLALLGQVPWLKLHEYGPN